MLAEKAQRMGATLVRATVSRLRPEDGLWMAETEQGALSSGMMVVAAGAWSMTLLEQLGLRIPLEAERGYHLLFRDPGVALSHSVMEAESKFVTSSMEMGVRSAGTAEFAGLDAPPNYRRARVLARLTKRMMPELNLSDTQEWMGVRPTLPDSLPCIGELPGHPGLFAAFGHSHYGLSMAPQTGRLVAELVSGITPNIDMRPYRADRFN
ncbi:MAG: FAD-binding oxidoreductase [Alphaproteobacteria bacterium]|nr:MAG: FAD-binding oxidoreductase [Alphaproteobacteria bacterium]